MVGTGLVGLIVRGSGGHGGGVGGVEVEYM